jgi:putative glutamine amidotransferase
MSVRIAIPEPTSTDVEYNQRALPQYLSALQAAGAESLVIPLHESPAHIASLIASTQGVLLPGSGFDVDPERYGEKPIPACGPADPARTAVDELLLEDAFNLHKPILGICQGLQSLNVWRNGSLIQDLETVLHTQVNHQPGREVIEAHPVKIMPNSRLESLLSTTMGAPEPALSAVEGSQFRNLGKYESQSIEIARGAQRNPQDAQSVNSSHHQAVHEVGDNLRIAAVSPADGVIEAVEIDSPDHFVVAVQWHPERTYTASPLSRALFAAFVHAAKTWQPRRINEPAATS